MLTHQPIALQRILASVLRYVSLCIEAVTPLRHHV
jgi:hypothetical protein